MNVLISIDKNYLKIADVMLYSLCKNNPGRLDVYVINRDLAEEDICWLESKVNGTKQFDMEFHDTKVDERVQLDFGDIKTHCTVETFYKAIAQFYLPESLDRILYLDVDMVVKGNLAELYERSFDGNYYVVCQDANNEAEFVKAHKTEIGLDENHRYFNAGVILMNLTALRKETTLEGVLADIQKNVARFEFLDQDFFNVEYRDRVRYAEYKLYNYQVYTVSPVVKKELEECRVIHYIGSEKPWNEKYINYNFSRFYWDYKCELEPEAARKRSKAQVSNIPIYVWTRFKMFVRDCVK